MSTDLTSRFLELQSLASLEHMRFTTRHRIEGAYSGRHQSRQQGGAGEFVDYREYAPGEDLRRLDWRVLARTGKAFTKLYQDETNLTCTLAIDVSGSMLFGGDGTSEVGSKLEYAQFLATGLSHVISRGQDQVGLAVLTDKLNDFIAPGGTPSHVALIQERIEHLETKPALNMAPALRDLFKRTNRRGVLLLLSDFLIDDVDETLAAIRLIRHSRSEVVLLHLIHPHEEQLPDGAAYRFEGLEQDGRVDCSPGEIRESYRQKFEAHVASVRTLALAAGCDYRRISTAIPYLQVLGGFLVER